MNCPLFAAFEFCICKTINLIAFLKSSHLNSTIKKDSVHFLFIIENKEVQRDELNGNSPFFVYILMMKGGS